jgi:two-component system, response regulator YesN
MNLKYYINLSIEEETTLKDSIESGNLDLAINCIKQIFQKIYNQKLQINTQIEWYEIVGFYSSILKKYGGNIYTIEIENKKLTQWVDESDDIPQLESRLIEMTKLFFSYLKKLKNKQYGPEITLAIEYLNNHYDEIIKLSDAASVVGLNTSYFSKKFKKVTGINFIDYLNNIRIEKAKEILQNTNKSIYVIAQEIGYSNDSYFCRIFKQSVGMSPQQYKKNSVKEISSTMR